MGEPRLRAGQAAAALPRRDGRPVTWQVSEGLVDYPEALAMMEARAEAIRQGRAAERVWLLQHPPIYTAGTAALDAAAADGLPLYRTGRGGQVTYHGPGQRVAYVMLDLSARTPDVRVFVAALERWIIVALAELGVTGERRETRVGVWVRRPDKPAGQDRAEAEDKIAAIGIRIRRWVTFHGISLNVAPDLAHYRGITPCGIAERHYGVTSLADLGRPAALPAVDAALRRAFETVFGPTADASPSA